MDYKELFNALNLGLVLLGTSSSIVIAGESGQGFPSSAAEVLAVICTEEEQ